VGLELVNLLFIYFFIQIFLKKFKLNVESMNAAVGTNEFMNGFGSFDTMKKRRITMYVNIAIMIFLLKLVSQALSASTRLFLCWIFLICDWRVLIVGIIELFEGLHLV
jgi:hypothetical protein